MNKGLLLIIVFLLALLIEAKEKRETLVFNTKHKKGKVYMVMKDSPKNSQANKISSKLKSKPKKKLTRKLKEELLAELSKPGPRKAFDANKVNDALMPALVGGAIGGGVGYTAGSYWRTHAMESLSNVKMASEYFRILNQAQKDTTEKLTDVKSVLQAALSKAKSQTNSIIDGIEMNASSIKL